MSLEASAPMLGQRSMDTTLRYAKIANRPAADEYFAVTDQVLPAQSGHRGSDRVGGECLIVHRGQRPAHSPGSVTVAINQSRSRHWSKRIDVERGGLNVLVNDVWGGELLTEWNT